MAAEWSLRQDGQDVAAVRNVERREPTGGAGPALIWCEVPAGTALDPGGVHELVSDGVARRIELLDYEPTRGLVIALEGRLE